MRIVIITGGIGSGKSQILKIIREYYPQYGTINADDVSREITNGDNFKKYLRSLNITDFKNEIFIDRDLRRKIEQFVHWRVMLKILLYLLKCWLSGTMLVAVEIPIWIEMGMYWLTRGNNVVVISKTEDRLERLKIRHTTEEQINRRISAQLPDSEKIKRADWVIENTKGISELEEQVKGMLIYYKPSFINILLGYIISGAFLFFFMRIFLNRWGR